MRHLGDITKISDFDIPIVDVITGGSPCQDLSVAGKRAGLAGERSGLFMEQIRIVKEMREHDRQANGRTDWNARPRYMVWENVPGAFSSNKGRDFQAVLSEIVRVVFPESPDVPMPERGGYGRIADVSMMHWEDGALLGDYTMPSFGECPNEENGSLLSQILEDCPHPKYSLSAKACAGILRRAKNRGRTLPPELEAALIKQSASKNEPESPGGGKGILIQNERTGALSTLNNQAVFSLKENEIVAAAGFSSKMGSAAHGIGYESEKAPTLQASRHDATVLINDCSKE